VNIPFIFILISMCTSRTWQ